MIENLTASLEVEVLDGLERSPVTSVKATSLDNVERPRHNLRVRQATGT